MTTVVPFQNGQQLTTLQRECAERWVWTEDQGRGWKPLRLNSSELQTVDELASAYEGRQEPMQRERIIAHLGRLANHFHSDRTPQAWKMLFEDYAEDLSGISEPHLREVITAHRNEKNWFPKCAELIERWRFLQYSEAEKLRRARVLLGKEDPKPWERE